MHYAVDVAPQPSPALSDEVAEGPGGRQLHVLVKPSPAQPRPGRALAEDQVFRCERRPVPGDDALGLAGDGEPLAVDVQRTAENALEDRAVNQAGMGSHVIGMAGEEMAERAHRVFDTGSGDAFADVVVAGEGRLDVAPGRSDVVIVEEDLDIRAVETERHPHPARVLQRTSLTLRADLEVRRNGEHSVAKRVVIPLAGLGHHPDLVTHAQPVAADLLDNLVDPVLFPPRRGDLDNQTDERARLGVPETEAVMKLPKAKQP